MLKRARRVIPGGINSCRRETDPAVCVGRGRGAYVEDLDGRELIDYHGAYGCILLGHCFPHVVERVSEAITRFSTCGVGVTEAEVELAERIVEHVPSIEQVVLTNSGGEATYNAIRLARGVTGREQIVKFQGCYHGSHDYVLPNALTLPGHDALDLDTSLGILPAARDSVLVARYNDVDTVAALFDERGPQIAGVIVEPMLHNAATIPPAEGFLEGLRSLCTRHGSLLIFDEVITGFRHGLGGYQAIAQVAPDLTTFAKAMGNGFPIGAIGGSRTAMEQFNTASGGGVFYSGTYNGNPAAVAAALATLDVLETELVHEHIFRLGAGMRTGLQEIVAGSRLEATVVGFGSIYGLIFAAGPLRTYEDVMRNDPARFLRYKRGLLRRGVLEMPALNAMRGHVSYSHTDADIDRTLAAAAETIAEMNEHELLQQRP